MVNFQIMNGMCDLASLRCKIRDSTLSRGNCDHTPTIFIPLCTTGSLEIKESGISTTYLLEGTFGIGIRK